MNVFQDDDDNDEEVVVTLKNTEEDDLNIEMDNENRYSLHLRCPF